MADGITAVIVDTRFYIMIICALCACNSEEALGFNIATKLAIKIVHDLALRNVALN